MGAYRNQPTNESFEKRRIPRFPVQLPIVLGHDEDDSSICTTLSSEGVSVETAKSLRVSQRIFIEVVLAPGQAPLRMQGQVVWKKDMDVTNHQLEPLYEIGIRFIRPLPNPWKMPSEYDPSADMFGFIAEQEEEFPDFIPPFA
ncbi:MAG: PilZ domain-containing protein [Bdellovibrionales bacterium]|nr:PilZ domain-containing protein [Bdellovibrionales bacterium]